MIHMGYSVALAKQFFSNGLYNPQLEEKLTVPDFNTAKGAVLNGFQEWFLYLADNGLIHIYLAGSIDHNGKNGIVVVCKKTISLWVALWEVDAERKPVSVIYSEYEQYLTESRSLEIMLKEKPDFVFCEGTFLSDNAVDNRKQLIASLEAISDFVKGYKAELSNPFVSCFDKAINIIQGKREDEQQESTENDAIQEYLSLTMFYHPDAEQLLNGLLRAWACVNNGSWNTTVKEIAERNGDGDKYSELTKDLHIQIIKGFLFCINKMDLYTINNGFYPVVIPYSKNWLQQAIHAYQNVSFPHTMIAQKEIFHEVLKMDRMYLLLHRNKIDRSQKSGQPFVGNVNNSGTLFICSDRTIAEKWVKDIPIDEKCFGVVDHASLISLCIQCMYWGVENIMFDGPALFIALSVREIIQYELQGKPMMVFNPPGTKQGDSECPLGMYPLAEFLL